MEVTHARVKYRNKYDNDTIRFVKIEDVIEFQTDKPKNKTDFDKRRYYSVKWVDEKNPDGVILPAQICQMACGEDEKDSLDEKRARFPQLSNTILEEFLDELESSDGSNENINDKEAKQNTVVNPKGRNVVGNEKVMKKLLKKKVQEKEKTDEALFLDEKLRTLTSTGLTYEPTDDEELSNTKRMRERLNDGQKEKDKMDKCDKQKGESNYDKDNDAEQMNKQEKWRDQQIAKYEKIIKEQRCTINKLQSDLQRSDRKIEILEEVNKRILNSTNPVKRNIFPQSSTPLKGNIVDTPFLENDDGVLPLEFKNDIPFGTDDEGTSGISSLAGGNKSKGTHNLLSVGPIISSVDDTDSSNARKNATEKQSSSNKRVMSPIIHTSKKMRNAEIDINLKMKKGKKKKQKSKQKKSQRNKKKKKCSDDDYDSDQYEGLTDLQNMKSWYKEVDDKKIKMMHLFFGVSIPYEAWKDIREVTKPSLFLRKLSKAIWGSYALMNRAINVSKTYRTLPNRSPRKCLTPLKKAVLRKVFFAFVNENVAPKLKKSTKSEWKKLLGAYINNLIKIERERQNKKDYTSTSNEDDGSSSDTSSSSTDSD